MSRLALLLTASLVLAGFRPGEAAGPPAPALAGAAAEADDPRWAFRPPVRPGLPAVRRAEWCRSPIDRFILARLEAAGLEPAPEADGAALIRRMSLDVLGLPPSPEEVGAFLRDESPGAVEKLVDRLLASPRYGERWARHWLDVVRFAESNGFETNTIRENAWPYRDYVIRALNEDRPYTRFILEQLAGDALGEDDATGFLVAGAYDTVKSPDRKLTLEQRSNELHDMVATAGSAFLGLTVGCARCHDHKFDPITQRDYFALEACFAGVEHGERELPWPDQEDRDRRAAALRGEIAALEAEIRAHEPVARVEGLAGPRRAAVQPGRNTDRFPPVEARRIRFTVLATSNLEPCLDEIEVYAVTAEPGAEPRNVALASAGALARASSEFPGSEIHRIAHLNDGRHGNGRSWISNEPGKGWAEIELPRPEVIDRVVWGRDREGKYRDRLPVEYRIETTLEPGRWRLVASSADRMPVKSAGGAGSPAGSPEYLRLLERRKALEKDLAATAGKRKVYAGVFREPAPTRRLHRGDPLEAREVVEPGAISYVAEPPGIPAAATERDRRTALAGWIASPENPLTARVIANRIWLHHFGRGLVATPGDFGANGARPTHPELLDWLARELADRGWSLKEIHRLILLSSTYRQSSRPDPRGLAADAETSLYWRYPPRRLEAEAIRDSILAVSGKLDLAMGGPGFDVFVPNDNYVRVYEPKASFGPAEWRRMVYQRKPRKEQDSTFGAFDCPDATQPASRRPTSTNAVQALNLLNAGFIIDQAGFLAERLRRESGEDAGAQARRGFLLAFGRGPDPAEEAAARALIREHGAAAFARALLNASELLYIP
jgi:hypothetical protein